MEGKDRALQEFGIGRGGDQRQGRRFVFPRTRKESLKFSTVGPTEVKD